MSDHDYFGGGDHDYVLADTDVIPLILEISDDPPNLVEGTTLECSPSTQTEEAPTEEAAISVAAEKQSVQPIKISDTFYNDLRGNYWQKVNEASSPTILRLKCIESSSVHKCLARATLKNVTNELKELNKHNHQPYVRSQADIDLIIENDSKSKKQSNDSTARKRKAPVLKPVAASVSKNGILPATAIPVNATSFTNPNATSTPRQTNMSANRVLKSKKRGATSSSIINGRNDLIRSLPTPINIHHLKELFNGKAYAEAVKNDLANGAVNTYKGHVTTADGEMAGFWFANETFLSSLELSLEIHTFGMDQLQLAESYPVSYLFTIYFIHEEVCVPVLYALLQKTSQQVYTAILQLFKDKLEFNLNGVNVLIGYNAALRKAAYDVFPFLLPKTCRFHYCLSLFNQMVDCKLKAVFNRNPSAFLIMKMLIALPFLPHRPRDELPDSATLPNCWRAILLHARVQGLLTSTTLKPILDHFESYWMRTIGPRMISVFDVSHKMNEIVEMFNSQLLLLIRNSPGFWVFYESLQNLDRKNVQAFIQNKASEPVTGHKPLEKNLTQVFDAYRSERFKLISLMEKLAHIDAGLIETYVKGHYPDYKKYLAKPALIVQIEDYYPAVENMGRAANILRKKRPNTSTPKLSSPRKKPRTTGVGAETVATAANPDVQILDLSNEEFDHVSMDVEIIAQEETPSASSMSQSKAKQVPQIDLLSSDDDIEELPVTETPSINDVRSQPEIEISKVYTLENDSPSAEPIAVAVVSPRADGSSGPKVEVPGGSQTLIGKASGVATNEAVSDNLENDISTPSAKVFSKRFNTYIYYDGKGYWFYSQNRKLQCVESKTSFRCKSTATMVDSKPLTPIITLSPHSHGPYKTTSNIVESDAFLARLEEQLPTSNDILGLGLRKTLLQRKNTTKRPPKVLNVAIQPPTTGSKDMPDTSTSVISTPGFDAAGPRKYSRPMKIDFKSFFEPRDLTKLKTIFLDLTCNPCLKIKGSRNNFCQSFIRPKGGDLIGFWLCNKEFVCDFVNKEKIDAIGFESLQLPTYKNLPLQHLIVVYVLSSKKITDIVYVLSLKPNYESYNAIAEILKSHIQLNMSNMRVIVGFEKYAREAILTAFPDAQIESCWSHFSRAVVETLSELQLVTTVKSNVDAMNVVRLIVALPLLPSEKTEDYGDLTLKNGWKHVNKEVNRRGLANTLKPLMDYVRYEWVNRLGPDKFSLFNRISTTEKVLELNDLIEDRRAYLYKISQQFDKFWEFYDKLRDMESSTRRRYLAGGTLPSDAVNAETSGDQKKSSVIAAKALDDVKKGESSLAQFMSAVGTCCPILLDDGERRPDEKVKEISHGFDIDNDSSDENNDGAGTGSRKSGIPSITIKRLQDFTLYYDGVGHYYNACGHSAKRRQLRCVERRSKYACPGSATMLIDPPNSPIELIRSHNHPLNTKHYIHTAPFLEALQKRYVRNEKNFKRHFDEELENFPAAKDLVKFNSVRQQIIRCNRKASVPNPTGLDQLAWVLQNPINRLKWSNAHQTNDQFFQGIFKQSESEDISGLWFSHLEFTQTLPGEYAIFFEAAYLVEHKLSEKIGVEQFVTVYFVVNGKAIPVLYAILADCSEDTYANLMKVLFFTFNLDGGTVPVILPPNVNLLKAAKRVAPSVKITSSWFYYNQAVLKKLEELNFKPKLRDQTKNSVVRMFLALALLPARSQEDLEAVTIEKALEYVLGEVEKHQLNLSLDDFVKYYQEFWMNEITPEAFSCYKTQQFNEFIEDSFLKMTLTVKLINSLWKIYIKARSSELRARKAFQQEIRIPYPVMDRKESPWTRNGPYIDETFVKFREGGFTFGEMLECLGTCHTGVLESFLQGRTDLKMTGLPEPAKTPGTTEANRTIVEDNTEGDECSGDATGIAASEADNSSYDPEELMKQSTENPIPSKTYNHRKREFTVYDDGRGFHYRCARRSDKRKYLRCVENRNPLFCRSIAYMEIEPPDSPIIMTKPHNHAPNLRKYSNDHVEFVEKVVERALNSDEPVRKVYEDELKKNPQMRLKVSYQSVRRTLYHHRKIGVPPVPSTLMAFEQLVLDPKHSKFALVRDGAAVFVQGRIMGSDGELIGIWMANKEFVLSVSRKWKLDAAGVFTVQPKMTVYRHLIIVYVYINEMCVPVLYVSALLDSEECFVKTMEIVRDDLNLNFNGIPVMLGFNPMVENATKQVFPTAKASFSWFHFIQNVLRQVEEMGLNKTIVDKPELFCIVRLLIALPLLPSNEEKNMSVIRGWESILTFTDAQHLFPLAKPILVKFRTHWIDAVGASAFTVFGSKIKTSSLIEDLHLKIEDCMKTRVPFWTLYEKIRQIEFDCREDFTKRQQDEFLQPPIDTYRPLVEELIQMAVRDNCRVFEVLKKIACSDIRSMQTVAHELPLNYLQFISNYSLTDETLKERSSTEGPDDDQSVLDGYSDMDDNRLIYEINDHPIASVALRGRNNSTVYYDGRGHYYHLHHKGQKRLSMRCVENKTKHQCKCRGYMDKQIPNSPIVLLPNNHHTHVPFIRDYVDTFPTVENVKQYEMGGSKNVNKVEEAEEDNRAAQHVSLDNVDFWNA